MPNYSIDECRKYIEKLNTEYFEKHIKEQERDELIAENNIEKRDIKGYHGREILELLQNTDDAYQKSIDDGEKPDCDLDVNIKYIDHVLTISNTGTCFDFDGIKAIVQGNNSPKKGRYIGSKGTGFRSILNWAKKIKIFSGNFNVKFSEENAGRLFDKIKDYPQIKKQLKINKNLYIPILSVPEYIESEIKNQQTIIEITVDESKIIDDYNVDNQLNSIDSKILLFLPNTNSITIETKEQKIVYCREKIENKDIIDGCIDKISLVTIKKIINNNEELSEDYELFEKTIRGKYVEDGDLKDVIIAIAVPFDKTETEANLYTYFPLLETKSPFNCIMHATYSLGDQRNTIIVNDNNKEIVVEQLKFLIDIAEKYYIKNKKYSEALNLLTPKNISSYYNFSFETGFARFKVEDEYINLIKDLKMFLNVNGELLSYEDNPVILENNFPIFVKGKEFENLVEKSINNEAGKLLKLIAKRNFLSDYKEEDLCNKISRLSNSLTIQQRVECFDWWEQNYQNYLPELIKDQNGNWINKNDECYFLDGDFEKMEIPNWIKVPAINSSYQMELFNIAKNKSKVVEYKNNNDKNVPISRIISTNKIYKLIDFKYRDKSTIISALNSSVDNYSKAVDFVKWLWKNYRYDVDWIPPNLQNTKYNFPAINNELAVNTQLYFGSEYGNDIAEKIFSINFKKFPRFDIFGIKESELEEFKHFISKFHIHNFPPIALLNVDMNSNYKEKLKQNIIINENIAGITSLDVYMRYIDDFENIISKLTTSEIISWISCDINLFTELSTKTYGYNQYKIIYKNRQYFEHTYRGYQIDNYLLYVLNNSKWFEIEGEKYSPKKIIYDTSHKSDKFSDVTPVLNRQIILKLMQDSKLSMDQIKAVLSLFSFPQDVIKLESNLFYGILLKIPNCERKKAVEMSRQIYRSIEMLNNLVIFEKSANQEIFWKEGKLLTQKGEFVLSSEIFVPSTLIVNKKKYNILDKSPRKGKNEVFIKILNCREYDIKPIIDKETIHKNDLNDKFQKELIEFKKYASAYDNLNQNIKENLPKLKIELVDYISQTIDGEKEVITENYQEIRETVSRWYVYLDETETEINIKKLSICIENIFTNIANTQDFDASKYGELFREEDKDFLIKKDFGSCEFIRDGIYAEELEANFCHALQKLIHQKNVDNLVKSIDFNNIDSEESMDCVMNILKSNNIRDINELYQSGFIYNLNLKDYYQNKINYIIGQNKDKYKNYLFTKALTENQEILQNSFLKEWDNFKNYKIEEDFAIICDIKDVVKKRFGDWDIDGLLNSEEIYALNYATMNPENKFAESISNDDKVKQLIYFNNKVEFDQWLSDMVQKLNENKNGEIGTVNYKHIIPNKTDIKYTEKTIDQKRVVQKIKRDKAFTEGKEAKKRQRQKQRGNDGELLIYNYLCKEYGKENVTPKSEAFVNLGLLKPGQEKSGDCDIEYYDPKTKEKYFVEVKTGDTKSFYITPNELSFAKNNAKNYKLFFVYNFDKGVPDFVILPSMFWNDDHYKQEEIIERILITF